MAPFWSCRPVRLRRSGVGRGHSRDRVECGDRTARTRVRVQPAAAASRRTIARLLRRRIAGLRSDPGYARHRVSKAGVARTAEHSLWRNPQLQLCRDQRRAYLAGELRDFDLTLDMQGTEFQRRVWRELRNIPYGETRSYSFVATTIGAPKAVRAVGAANGRNPIPIVVPCHRVIGAGGSLVGYGGGLPLKRFLLDLEARHSHLFREA